MQALSLLASVGSAAHTTSFVSFLIDADPINRSEYPIYYGAIPADGVGKNLMKVSARKAMLKRTRGRC
jgi:hypothetical protein